jgi:hypothetical protein
MVVSGYVIFYLSYFEAHMILQGIWHENLAKVNENVLGGALGKE